MAAPLDPLRALHVAIAHARVSLGLAQSQPPQEALATLIELRDVYLADLEQYIETPPAQPADAPAGLPP